MKQEIYTTEFATVSAYRKRLREILAAEEDARDGSWKLRMTEEGVWLLSSRSRRTIEDV